MICCRRIRYGWKSRETPRPSLRFLAGAIGQLNIYWRWGKLQEEQVGRESQGFGLLQMCKNTCLLNGGHRLRTSHIRPFPHSLLPLRASVLEMIGKCLQSSPFHTIHHPRVPERDSIPCDLLTLLLHLSLCFGSFDLKRAISAQLLCSGSRGRHLALNSFLASLGPYP